MYINKVILYGNLTRDPELRSMPSGVKVASFSIATNRTYKDKDGNKNDQADFHNVSIFGKPAELVNQYMKKGSAILVEGRIQTKGWESNGQKKFRTEVIAERIQFGPRTGGVKMEKPNHETQKDELEKFEYPEENINPDDIPF